MDPDALVPLGASLGAVAAVTAAVLSDVVAYDRRVRGPREGVRASEARPEPADDAPDAAIVGGLAGAADAAAADAPRAGGGDAPDVPHGREVPEVPEVPEAAHPAADDDSMLGAWTATDVDERSPLRRVVSALVLLTLTLVTAALIGAAIYRGLQNLS